MIKLKSNITEKQAQSALHLTAEIIDNFGPRLTGTPACKQAGERLKTELEKSCPKTASEKFQCSRDAFLYFIRYFSISYLGAFICLIASGCWTVLAAILTSFGCIMAICEFVFYKEFLTRCPCSVSQDVLSDHPDQKQSTEFFSSLQLSHTNMN